MNLPNLITLGRTISVPFIFWLLIAGHTRTAFFLFLIAGVSDALDGFLAKRFNWQTELGAYLDPLADKLLLVSVFVALGSIGELSLWLVVAVVSRDILIIIGVVLAWVLGNPVRIKPNILSKANTLFQIILALVVLADMGFDLGWTQLRMGLGILTGLCTGTSLLNYAYLWMAHMNGQPKEP